MPFLTLVTVVYNDWPGLERTLASVVPHRSDDVEHWVIDGSTTTATLTGLQDPAWSFVRLLHEPDDGLYDAMNKGLERATGDYVLFLNAGDELHESFDLEAVRKVSRLSGDTLLLGYSLECWSSDEYLRPGLGKEASALARPAHQATFYPRSFYREHRYDLRYPVAADGYYTEAAAQACGATFVPAIICRFAMGGRSSSYGDLRTVRARFHEHATVRTALKLASKTILWRVTPRRLFYRLLAVGKYTRASGPTELQLLDHPLHLVSPSN